MGRMMREYFLPLLGNSASWNTSSTIRSVPDSDVTPEYCAQHNWLIGSPATVARKAGERSTTRSAGSAVLLVFGFDYVGKSGGVAHLAALAGRGGGAADQTSDAAQMGAGVQHEPRSASLRRHPAVAVGGEGIWLHTRRRHGDHRRIRRRRGGRLGSRQPSHRRGDRAPGLDDGLRPHRNVLQPAGGGSGGHLLDGEPGGLTHAYFCSSGSEGTEAAIKLARQYFLEIGQPQRTRFIARRQGYHGNTLGALAAGGNMMRRANITNPF